jgi:hypothetical protein
MSRLIQLQASGLPGSMSGLPSALAAAAGLPPSGVIPGLPPGNSNCLQLQSGSSIRPLSVFPGMPPTSASMLVHSSMAHSSLAAAAAAANLNALRYEKYFQLINMLQILCSFCQG